MIMLNSISKIVGKAQLRRTVLEDVNWIIRDNTHVAILGSPHSGAGPLLDIIGGMTLPTSGWVDRQATVSVPGGLLRYAARDTTRQLISRLSDIYRVDAIEINTFVTEALGSQVLNVPPGSLQQQLRQQLNLVLTYAFPYDFYLFNSVPSITGDPKIQAFCRKALEQRGKQAGIIIRSTSAKAARRLDPDMMGAVVYAASLTLYERLADAIAVFESLPPENDNAVDQLPDEPPPPLESEDILF